MSDNNATDRTLAYAPRPQFMPFHQRDKRFACMVCHRRAGKTVASVNELVVRALYTPKTNARYAYVAPFYRQARDIAWEYLKEAAEPFISSRADIRESELRVKLVNGNWVTLYGSDNPDTLRGIYLDGVILDEFGDCRPSLWQEVILPCLADRDGWAVVIGTPKQKNHFYRIYQRSQKDENWYSLMLKASDSGILSPATLEMMRAEMSDEQYAQEMECSFTAALTGTYYAGQIERLERNGQIKEQTLYDPSQPVNAVCDLGYTDSTAWWFWQERPDGIAVIDYYENAGQPLRHYLDYLDDKQYQYDTIWLPHDARAKTLQTGKSTIEQVLEFFKPTQTAVQIVPQMKLQHGIDAARLVLDKCYFDQVQCTDGVEALRAYKRRYDEVTKSYSDKPMHDFSSHGSDAFRYLSLVVKQKLKIAPAMTALVDAPAVKNSYTLNDLFNDNEAKTSLSINRMRI